MRILRAADSALRASFLLAACTFISAAIPDRAHAWGARTHEIINRRAVDRLPEPARQAWAPLARELGAHANDADRRKSTTAGEPSRHFFDIDMYGEPPFDDLPRDRAELEKKHGAEFVERFGVVPWAIAECYDGLVASMARGDWASAGAWAADLGHYVADSHQPLHCTKNYDGKDTGNDGIHRRFETKMMDRHFDESMLGASGVPRAIRGGPLDACFDWIVEAHRNLPPILAADHAARAIDPRFGEAYMAELWRGSGEVAVLQVDRAVRDLASLYQAAWIEAGSPLPPAEIPSFAAAPPAPPAEAPARRSVGLPVALAALGVVLGALVIFSF